MTDESPDVPSVFLEYWISSMLEILWTMRCQCFQNQGELSGSASIPYACSNLKYHLKCHMTCHMTSHMTCHMQLIQCHMTWRVTWINCCYILSLQVCFYLLVGSFSELSRRGLILISKKTTLYVFPRTLYIFLEFLCTDTLVPRPDQWIQ